MFKRSISSPKLVMRGAATFINHSAQTVHYHEEGSYLWQGHKQTFYQDYVYIIDNDNLSIVKSSGDLLHEFHLPKKNTFPIRLKHVHSCKNDRYHLQLYIPSSTRLYTVYEIIGPNKNYRITTCYSRIT